MKALLVLLGTASLALTLYAGLRLLDGDTAGVLLWFAGAAVLHDLVLLPAYAAADRALQRLLYRRGAHRPGTRAPSAPRIDYVRVPAFVSGVLFLVWFPLILDQVELYEPFSTLSAGVFLPRWLLITGCLFAASACCLVVREWRAGRAGRTSR